MARNQSHKNTICMGRINHVAGGIKVVEYLIMKRKMKWVSFGKASTDEPMLFSSVMGAMGYPMHSGIFSVYTRLSKIVVLPGAAFHTRS